MKRLNFDYLKKSSIYFTPNFPETSTTRYKLSLLRVAGYISLYTIFSWLIIIFILAVTPLKDFLFVVDNQELVAQKDQITELQKKVVTLTKNLQMVVDANEKMKYAIMLADKDSVKPSDKIYDTLKKPIKKKIQIGGNIFAAVKNLFENIFQSENKPEKIIFQEPANGYISKAFDPASGHLGVDYGMRTGTPIYASSGGFVLFSDYTINDGNTIIIEHESRYVTVYKHCSSLLKKAREFVKQGELIALSGNSGKNTTGPHLHFEIWHDGKPVDPNKLILK